MTARYPCEETTLDIVIERVKIRLWFDNPMPKVVDLVAFRAKLKDQYRKWMMKTPVPLDYMAFHSWLTLFTELIADQKEATFSLSAVQVQLMLPGSDDYIGHMIYTIPFGGQNE